MTRTNLLDLEAVFEAKFQSHLQKNRSLAKTIHSINCEIANLNYLSLDDGSQISLLTYQHQIADFKSWQNERNTQHNMELFKAHAEFEISREKARSSFQELLTCQRLITKMDKS